MDMGGNNQNLNDSVSPPAPSLGNQSLGFQAYAGQPAANRQQQPTLIPRLSRANSFGNGSVAASEDQHPSLYIAKGGGGGGIAAAANGVPSDVDSDTMRKQSAMNLKREFE